MASDEEWSLGPLWVESLVPIAIGASCGIAVILEGGPLWAPLVLGALSCGIWQLALRLRRRLSIRVVLVASLAIATLVYYYLSSRLDTAGLYQAIVDANIGVDAVSSDRKTITVSIQPVSWGPERTKALRTVFAAAQTYAKSQTSVNIRWGDAMTSRMKMKDILEFTGGRITYREMINRIDWSGTPEVLPSDSTSGQKPGASLEYT